jgi:hypothetical protein
MTLEFSTLLIKILACIPIDRYKKIGTICVKDTCLQIPLAALKIFKVEVLQILWQLTLYAMIYRPKTNNIHKINQIEQQIEEFQYDDAIAR